MLGYLAKTTFKVSHLINFVRVRTTSDDCFDGCASRTAQSHRLNATNVPFACAPSVLWPPCPRSFLKALNVKWSYKCDYKCTMLNDLINAIINAITRDTQAMSNEAGVVGCSPRTSLWRQAYGKVPCLPQHFLLQNQLRQHTTVQPVRTREVRVLPLPTSRYL